MPEKNRQTVAIALAAFIFSTVWLGVRDRFTDAVKEEIFRADVNPSTVVLSKGEILEQWFRAENYQALGVYLLSENEANFNRKIKVEIKDKRGAILAASDKYTVDYFNEAALLKFKIKKITLNKKEPYLLRVTLVEGSSLGLTVREKEFGSNSLMYGGREINYNLSFSLLRNNGINRTVVAGIYAGFAFFFGILLTGMISAIRWRYVAAFVITVVIIPAGMLGFWFSTGDYGIADWDMVAAIQHGYRDSIVNYRQFPLWNAIPCGGTAGIADPEFSVLSIPFMLVLFLGVIPGLKAGILFSIMLLAAGVFILAKEMKISPAGSALASLVVSAGGAFALHAAEGHIYIVFAFAWLPWFTLALYRAYRNELSWYWVSLILLIILLQGGVYALNFSLLIFAGFIIFARRKRAALWLSVKSGLVFLALGAFKLLPMIYWTKHYQDNNYSQTEGGFRLLWEMLAGRHLLGDTVFYNQQTGWHEYGAYVGLAVLTLSAIGLWNFPRSRIVRLLCAAFLLLALFSMSGPVLKGITDKLPFLPRSNVSRTILLATIPLALLAAKGLDSVTGGSRHKYITSIIIGSIAVDLMVLSSSISSQAFVLRGNQQKSKTAQFPISYSNNKNATKIDGVEYYRRYLDTKKGYGFMFDCPSLAPYKGASANNGDEEVPFSQLINGGEVSVLSWSHNKILLKYVALKDGILTANQNFAPGWQADGRPGGDYRNKLATAVKEGEGSVLFEFKPEGLAEGVLISLLTAGIISIKFATTRKLLILLRNYFRAKR